MISTMKTGFINGCFDRLHEGHIHFIKEARKRCDRLIVGLNSDSSVLRLKGKGRPIQGKAKRLHALLALPEVDDVRVFDELTALECVKKVAPDVLVKEFGYDHCPEVAYVLGYRGMVAYIARLPGVSTTGLIDKETQ